MRRRVVRRSRCVLARELPCRRHRAHRQRGDHGRAPAGRRVHHERPVRELDPFAHRGETYPSALQVLAGLAGVEALAVVDDLDAELPAGRLHRDRDRDRVRVLGRVRQGLLDDAVGQGLEILWDLAARAARELGVDEVVAPEPVDRLTEGRDQAALLQERRTESGHQPPEIVRLLRELGAHLGQDAEPSVDLAGLQHQEHRLERQRCGRDPLHRPVVQVARDAVALPLDRRVGPAHDPRPVLVAVLQELEQRADRLVGHPGRRDVADQEQPPGWVAGDLRRPRFEVDGVTLALERPLPGHRQRVELLVGLDRGGERAPRLTFDERLREVDHLAEGPVRADDDVAGVELDDAVDRGLEHGAEAFLGLAQGLVRALEPRQGHVGLAERGLLLVERVVDRALGLRPSDLIHEDPERDRRRQEADQERGLVVAEHRAAPVDRDQGEGGAGRGDGQGREDGPAVPRRNLTSFGDPPGDDADERRDEQGGERDRQVDLGTSDLERSAQPQLREPVHTHTHPADREEHPEVRDVRSCERQGTVGRCARSDDQRELRGPRGVGHRVGTQGQEQHRADRGAQQRDVGHDLAAVLTGHVLAELDRHGDQEQHARRQEPHVVQAEPRRFGSGGVGHEQAGAHDPDRRDPKTERRGAPPRALVPAPEQDDDRGEEAGTRDEGGSDVVRPARTARRRVGERHTAARDEEDEGREPRSPALCLRGHRSKDHDAAGGLSPPSPDRGQPEDLP